MKKRFSYKTRLAQVLGLVGLVVMTGQFVFASGETISSSDSFSAQIKIATPINDLVINGTGNSTVPVKLLVTSGTLAMGTTTGLTFTGSPTGSTLYFSGTRSDVNAALATLTYTRNTLGTDTLEVSLVSPGEVFFPGTNHLYEYVSGVLTWNGAKTAAEGRTKYGATGYLTTITSQAENDFVSARLTNAGWMGASDIASEGAWKWVTGPEATPGTVFSNGNSPSMVPVAGQYQNWNSGEPNDSGSNEDCGQFLAGGSGQWNDLPCTVTTLPGYVVEYGATGNMPTVAAKNIGLTTVDAVAPTTPGTPTSTTPTSNQKPVWTWTAATDAGVGLANPAYSLQWSQSSSFSSGVSTATTNTTSYTHTSNLADGTWYFRVRASDTSGNNSSYSGNGSVVVDATAPTAPGLSASTTKTHVATPTISWDASTDTGTGLANPTYTIQRSQSSSFGSGITSATTNSTSFTTPTLADGTWYFRVKATDQIGNVSAWSSTVTITIDTVVPTVPGTPSTATPTNTKKPIWSWTVATDGGTGLHNPAYTVQWSQSSSFSGGVSSATTNTASYTHTSNLADGTWYFRVLASDDAGNDSSYSANGSVVIDTVVAAISEVLATSTSATTQTIGWATDKLSSSQVVYGPSTTYGSVTATTDTSPRAASHTVSLSGLIACTTYHYQVVSTDALGNQATSSDMTFITSGCAGAAVVIDHAENTITASSGGSVTLPTAGSAVTLNVPANFSGYNADFQIKQLDAATALASIGAPLNMVPAGKAYDLKAMKDTTTPITSFAHNISVTLPYTNAEAVSLIESSMVIYRWDSGTGWQLLDDCRVDITARTVTCATPGFSTFVLFGVARPVTASIVKTATPVAARTRQLTVVKDETAPATEDAADTTTASDSNASKLPLPSGLIDQKGDPEVAAGSNHNPYWWLGGLIVFGFFFILLAKRRKKKDADAQK